MADSNIGKVLSKRLELKRKEYGYTQTGLANVLNVKQSEIAKWESGVVPKVETLEKLAWALNVSIDYLIGRSEEENLNDKFISDQTGLNKKAISILRSYNKLSKENNLSVQMYDGSNYFKGIMDVLNSVLEADEKMVKVINDNGMAIPTNDLFGYMYKFLKPLKTADENEIELWQMRSLMNINKLLLEVYQKGDH